MDLVEVTANKALQGPARGSDLQGAELDQGTTFSFLLLPQRRTCPGRERSRHKKKKQDLGWRPRSQDGFQRRLAQLFPQLF